MTELSKTDVEAENELLLKQLEQATQRDPMFGNAVLQHLCKRFADQITQLSVQNASLLAALEQETKARENVAAMRSALAMREGPVQDEVEYKRGFSDGLKEAPTGEAWIRVINEVLSSTDLGVAELADDYGTAKKKFIELIRWSIDCDRNTHTLAAELHTNQNKDFLSQFTTDPTKEWPEWMRNASYTASASFPKPRKERVTLMPIKFAPEEIARGCKGIRWVTAEGVFGRPTDHDIRVYLSETPTATGCNCAECKTFYNTPQQDVKTIIQQLMYCIDWWQEAFEIEATPKEAAAISEARKWMNS